MKKTDGKNQLVYNFNNGGYTLSYVSHTQLPNGSYRADVYDSSVGLKFRLIPIVHKHDKYISIKSGAHGRVEREVSDFLEAGTRDKFHKFGFLYKRNLLLHGIPGTGKTMLVNHIAQQVTEKGGTTIFTNDIRSVVGALEALKETQPDDMILVIMEEFDSWAKNYESVLLTLLDGQIQKDNIMFLATTNFLSDVPKRLLRPGRFSSIVKIGLPSVEARRKYLQGFEISAQEVDTLVKETQGLTLDEIKETILAHFCLGQNLQEIIKKIKSIPRDHEVGLSKNSDDDDDWDVYSDSVPF